MKHPFLHALGLAAVCACTSSTTGSGPVEDAGVTMVVRDAGALPPTVLTFATFNTARFFDTVCDSGNCVGSAFEDQLSPSGFAQKAATLRDGILGLQADVVMLQEVESQACLDALVTLLEDVYPVAILGEYGTPASLDVAILAKGRLLEVQHHLNIPLRRPDGTSTRFSRDLLEVHLDFGGQRVVGFAAHFRSQFNDDPGRRLAEAQMAHTIITARTTTFPDAVVVLGGDLNDTPGSPPINALDANGTLQRVAADRGAAAGTYVYNGSLQAIDHIYLGRDSAGSYIPGSAQVVGDPASGYSSSDHAALRAQVSLP
jgi:endonuclease/exonuclease/phosphatase family metal-dependent hydrolase